MITFECFAARPSAFASLCALTLADFEALYQDFARFYARDRQDSLTRAGKQRQRAAGGGTQFSQDGRTRLLMALVWLRVYPTYEVLGFFCLHKANAQHVGNGSAHRLCLRTARNRAKETALGASGHGRIPRCAPGH